MAETRSVMLVSPVPMVAGSNPRPVSLIVRVSIRSSALAVIVTVVPSAAVFGGILQRFAAAEIEGGLDRSGVAAEVLQVKPHGDRGAPGDSRQGSGQTAAYEQPGGKYPGRVCGSRRSRSPAARMLR